MKLNVRLPKWDSVWSTALISLVATLVVWQINSFAGVDSDYQTDWALAEFVGAMATHLVMGQRKRHLEHLVKRITNGDGDTQWDVVVNQVRVGRITDSAYALIQTQRLVDHRLYVAQAINLGHVLLRCLNLVLHAVPFAAFWLAIVLAVAYPDLLLQIVSVAQTATPESIHSSIGHIARVVAPPIVGITLGGYLALGVERFGFKNVFAEAIATEVRRQCGVAADGEVKLVRVSGDRLRLAL